MIPTKPFEWVSIDLWGPITPSDQGNRFVLTVVDAFSKFVIAVPLSDKTAEQVVHQFTNESLSSVYPKGS